MKRAFGTLKTKEKAELYLLKNEKGMEVAISDYGATIVNVIVPDKEGHPTDVVLGYDDVSGYEKGDRVFGAFVGRVANRIAGGSFTLNGKTYELTKNDGDNTLHGGRDMMNKRMWKVEESTDNSVTLSLDSPDGDQGFPGNLKLTVTYTVTPENELEIVYGATADADTLLNLTNHSYFNLAGQGSGDVLDQKVTISADYFTLADAQSIPTGELTPVKGTPMDFNEAKAIGQDIEADYQPLIDGKGYDHNWVIRGEGFRKAASMYSDKTGIHMDVYTDLPGMQLYTANYVDYEKGKGGAEYRIRNAACFETQFFPDAIHHSEFAQPVIKANELFTSKTVYQFSIQ